jgi:hypothetical protein
MVKKDPIAQTPPSLLSPLDQVAMRFIGTLAVAQERCGSLFFKAQRKSSTIGRIGRMNFA